MKKNVIVAGGAGFIGRHLCKTLLEKNYNVVCLDNLYTGSLDNIREFLDHPNFQMRKHDIVVPYQGDADFIYNLACPASPVHYQRSPTQTLRTAVFGTRNMLECARRAGATMLQASTSEVYGDPLEHPQRELLRQRQSDRPARLLRRGQAVRRSLCLRLSPGQREPPIKVFGSSTRTVPRCTENDGRVVSNFIVQALPGEAITIYGDGSQTRSFCYVRHLVAGMSVCRE